MTIVEAGAETFTCDNLGPLPTDFSDIVEPSDAVFMAAMAAMAATVSKSSHTLPIQMRNHNLPSILRQAAASTRGHPLCLR